MSTRKKGVLQQSLTESARNELFEEEASLVQNNSVVYAHENDDAEEESPSSAGSASFHTGEQYPAAECVSLPSNSCGDGCTDEEQQQTYQENAVGAVAQPQKELRSAGSRARKQLLKAKEEAEQEGASRKSSGESIGGALRRKTVASNTPTTVASRNSGSKHSESNNSNRKTSRNHRHKSQQRLTRHEQQLRNEEMGESVISEYVSIDSILSSPSKREQTDNVPGLLQERVRPATQQRHGMHRSSSSGSSHAHSDKISLFQVHTEQNVTNQRQIAITAFSDDRALAANLLPHSESQKELNLLTKQQKTQDQQSVARLARQNLHTAAEVHGEEDVRSGKSLLSSQTNSSDLYLLKQMRERELLRPIYLNVMVLGESAIGKSTFIDAFLAKKFQLQQVIRPSTKEITENRGTRKENNITFHLNMIDVPGYRHDIAIAQWYQRVKKYIMNKFEQHDQMEESVMQRKLSIREQEQMVDGRVHVCLYFFQGPRIKKLDLRIMKKLSKYLNVIPVLAKGDCYTQEEVLMLKQELCREAAQMKLEWFDCEAALKHLPQSDQLLQRLKNGPFGPSPPFLMIASGKRFESQPGVYVFGRRYHWGVCNIENPFYSDFQLLYQLLIGHFSLELINVTKHYYYRQYQRRKEFQKQSQAKQQQKVFTITGALFTIGISLGSFLVSRVRNKAKSGSNTLYN